MQTIDIDNYRIYCTERKDHDPDYLLGKYYKNKQIHSDNIYHWEEGEDFIQQEADAIVTNILHKKIVVRVADCPPVLLLGKEYFAIVHAGWKGLRKGVLAKAVKSLQLKGEQ